MKYAIAARLVTAADCDKKWNPFCGVSPRGGAFGVQFHDKLTTLLAGVWAIVLVGTAIATLIGVGKWGFHRYHHDSEGVTAGAKQAKVGGMSFGVAAGISLLFTAILAIAR